MLFGLSLVLVRGLYSRASRLVMPVVLPHYIKDLFRDYLMHYTSSLPGDSYSSDGSEGRSIRGCCI